MKKLLLIAFMCPVAAAFAAPLEVTDVSARQRWPWNGLVDMDFKIGGDSVADLFRVEVHATYAGGTKKIIGSTYLDEPLRGHGWNRLTWDFGADCPETKIDDMQIAVVATPISRAQMDAQDVYMVIDLSSGPNSSRYPVRYTTTAPTLVPTNDLVACAADPNRTTKLWLKRMKAGKFPFGGTTTNKGVGYFEASLSPYYIGIFELTQKQWYLVKGDWPSAYSNETYRAARPVEQINYEDVIGHNNWPDDRIVAANSFVGRMRARTGIATLNLPTECQWEYACRAGTRTSASAGLTTGRYSDNSGTYSDLSSGPNSGTALVGSYNANAWGLYDCFGNVMEMCLDAFKSSSDLATFYEYDGTTPIEDPIGPPTYSPARYHATRGGSFYNSGGRSSDYDRFYCNNDSVTGTRDYRIGMRVAVSPEWK